MVYAPLSDTPKYSYLRSSAIPTSCHLLPFWGWGGLLYLCRGRGGHGGSSALPLHRWHDYEAKLQLETARGWGKNWRLQGPQRPPRPAVSSSCQGRSFWFACFGTAPWMQDGKIGHIMFWAASRCRILTQGLYIEQTASDWSEGWWLWTNRMIQVTDICKVSGCMDRKLLSYSKKFPFCSNEADGSTVPPPRFEGIFMKFRVGYSWRDPEKFTPRTLCCCRLFGWQFS